MNTLQYLIGFPIAFAILINIHELGHYFVARWCGVKILRFSVGLGKVVFSRRYGPDQTEWAISMIPLGGYVMMLDERNQDMASVSEADLKREFTRQSVWCRIAIVAAGPGANFLLAIALLGSLYFHGLADFNSRIAAVPQQSIAANAGLQGQERIFAVNGEPVSGWSDLSMKIMQAANGKKTAELRFDTAEGGSGNATLALDGLSTKDLEGDFMATLGLRHFWPPRILQVIPGGSGAKAGLHDGDLILSIDGKTIFSEPETVRIVQQSAGKSLHFRVQRSSSALDFDIVPAAVKDDGDKPVGRIDIKFAEPETVTLPHGALSSVVLAVQRTWDMSVLQVTMIGKIITGEISLRNLNGALSIADYAGHAAQAGVITFLGFLASLSIAIGVMNLLPIPVLDGGLLLYYSLEVLTRRPIPRRFGEIAQIAGIVMLATLMCVALFNDVVRLDLVKKIAELVGAA